MNKIEDQNQINSVIKEGHYAKKQINANFKLISFSHAQRFKIASELLKGMHFNCFLDYGCGDGSFLAFNKDLFNLGIGYELKQKDVDELNNRFQKIKNLKFIIWSELEKEKYKNYFQGITCQEVFEHCLPDIQNKILKDLKCLLETNGKLLISVPIEIGPTLLLKQIGRRLAAWLNIGDYKYMETYNLKELIRAVFANKNTHFDRPVYDEGQIGHKGFNWKLLEIEIQKHFNITKKTYSPFPFFKGLLNSQVFWLCEHKK